MIKKGGAFVNFVNMLKLGIYYEYVVFLYSSCFLFFFVGSFIVAEYLLHLSNRLKLLLVVVTPYHWYFSDCIYYNCLIRL